jgi:hypothetical protein
VLGAHPSRDSPPRTSPSAADWLLAFNRTFPDLAGDQPYWDLVSCSTCSSTEIQTTLATSTRTTPPPDQLRQVSLRHRPSTDQRRSGGRLPPRPTRLACGYERRSADWQSRARHGNGAKLRTNYGPRRPNSAHFNGQPWTPAIGGSGKTSVDVRAGGQGVASSNLASPTK